MPVIGTYMVVGLQHVGMQVRMCSICAGAFQYDETSHDTTPNTHADVGDYCPTMYRE